MNKEYNEVKIIEKDGNEHEVTLLTTLQREKTARGFGCFIFRDRYRIKCSLQASSLATEAAIWFGVDDPEPVIRGKNGWEKYPIPEEVLLKTRMHLTQEQVKTLLPILIHFAKTGELKENYKEDTKNVDK